LLDDTEEFARQKFAKVPVSPGKIKVPGSHVMAAAA
jgi:hypothetical protein